MPITIQCPNPACGMTATVADGVSGRNVKCKRCGTPFVARQTIDGSHGDTRKSRPSQLAGDPFPSLPAVFGRYRVLRLLGRGGMGSVFLAEDSQLGRQVALKLPAFGPGESPKRVERFVREAQSAAVLQHANICTVYDAGQIDGRPFITMAFIDGKPLEDTIDPNAPMPQERAAAIARKVALALVHAHAKGIVHRDLKPANVMLTADDEPVVMDFGLAKRVSESDTNEARLTRDGAVMGTPSYMAPEQVRAEADRVGPVTDVYALGVILFEMLTGQTPYTGPLGVVMGQILNAPVPPVSEFRRNVDARLNDACRRAMAKDPADRFPTMATFAEALGAYLKGTTEASISVVPVVPLELPAESSPFGELGAEPVAPSPRRTRTAESQPAVEPTRRAPKYKGKQRSSLLPVWIAVGVFALIALVAGVVLTIRTKHGDVVIELSDPKAKVEVKVDGERIEVTGLDKPLTLTVGEHGLTVTGPDFETVTERFIVKRGANEPVRVTLKRRPAVVAGKKPPDTKAEPTPVPSGGPVVPVNPPADGWVSLFNGTDLTGWMSAGGGASVGWVVRDGAIFHQSVMPAKAQASDLWTEERFGDFVLELEFKTDGNSGVWLRADVPSDRFVEALEVAIDSPQSTANKFCTGALYGVAAPSRDASRAGEWNTMAVTARGHWIEIVINGQSVLIVYLDHWKTAGQNPDGTTHRLKTALRDMKREGHIGLQAHNGNTHFRNIRVKRLDAPAAKVPPADATRLGNSAFKVYPQNRSWKEAKALCESFGGRLAVIESEVQNKFVTGLMTTAGLAEAWVGATDEVEEGKWVWIDGTPLGYTNWDAAQPNNKNNAEHYMLMWVGRNGEYRDNAKWADQPSESSQHKPGFVCEWVIPAGAAAPAAADGFVPLFNGKDLTGWRQLGAPGGYSVTDGVLRIDAPGYDMPRQNGWLMTEKEYTDFVLRLHFAFEGGADSGIGFRCDPAIESQAEINFSDDRDPFIAKTVANNPTLRAGGLAQFVSDRAAPLRGRGEWNVLTVELIDRKLKVTLNGVVTVGTDLDQQAAVARAQPKGDRPGLNRRAGPVGLQKRAGTTRFRNIEIRELTPGAP